ncbi:MAG TPA: hypothetical protein PKC55_01410 [Dysgonomonas sp.]|uniref:hypothetical protein n=1 Tax=unclassified Dysgonomonas TaxID=2630389 RepID=UPI0025C6DDA6|nr:MULTISPECIES: hypothetical protein [unclassified Dysgonomonas]HML63463.1 hypothetical protein [Dysgonomonas sp.]
MRKRIFFLISFFLFTFFLFAQEVQTIHVMVALCDNKYQGIVKVPKRIGNGQDPDNNLYWGCGYGVRTYFKKSPDWQEVRHYKSADDICLERIVFKHKTKNYYLVADAYDGRYISDCTIDFLKACAGSKKNTIKLDDKTILGLYGDAKLVAYIGHNGLMDFSLANRYQNTDGKKRDAIILACYSKRYFSPYLQSAKAEPLLWSTHLMSPEAYTLHDAIAVYINGGTSASIREAAAMAYNKYQKCGMKGARGLLVTGF